MVIGKFTVVILSVTFTVIVWSGKLISSSPLVTAFPVSSITSTFICTLPTVVFSMLTRVVVGILSTSKLAFAVDPFTVLFPLYVTLTFSVPFVCAM